MSDYKEMEIIKVKDCDKLNYKELLLQADEQMSMIEKYLYRGDMFALLDDGVKAVCVVTREPSGDYELKNIAAEPEHQQKGYGRQLISFVVSRYQGCGAALYVGTGDCPRMLSFYEKCGFVKSHVIKNFFVDNYDHLMFDEGRQLIDMIYLKQEL